MADTDKEPNWLALSSQEEKPDQVLPGHHWEKNPGGGWMQTEDDFKPMSSKPIDEDVSYLRDIQVKRAPVIEQAAPEPARKAAEPAPKAVEVEEEAAPAKSAVKQYTPNNKAPVVTPAMIKAAGFDNLRDYMNAQQGLVRRGEKTAPKSYENKAKFDPAAYSAFPLEVSRERTRRQQKAADLGKSYAKGGKINLADCKVNTTPKNKSSSKW